MVLSLIPMSAFAASGDVRVINYRDAVPFNAELDGSAGNSNPELRLDNTVEVGRRPMQNMTTNSTFTVSLSSNVRLLEAEYPPLNDGNLEIIYTGPQTLRVRVINPAAAVDFHTIPLFFRANGAGEVTAKFEQLEGFNLSTNSFKVATIVRGQTTAVVDKIGNIARNNSIIETTTSEARLRLTENSTGAWTGADRIEIRIDNADFTFGAVSARLNGGAAINATIDGATPTSNISVIDGGRTLSVNVAALNNVATKDELVFNMPLRVARDARVGADVTATFRGDVNPSQVTLAKYTDYAVELKAEKVLEVYAGQDVPGRYVSTVNFEEMIPGSLLDGRVLEVSLVGVDKDGKDSEEVAAFQFGETIRLTPLRGTGDLNIANFDLTAGVAANSLTRNALVNKRADGSTGAYLLHDLMEIEVNRGSNIDPNTNVPQADKWELKVPFVVSTDYAGDLFLKFHGAGVNEQKVKIADVKAPVTFEIGKEDGKLADLNIGQQNQAAPDVTIKEVVAGALVEKDIVRGITPDNRYGITTPDKDRDNMLQFGAVFTKGSTAVKEGDARLDRDSRDFNLKERSSKPATFVISDVHVTLDRTTPYGEFKIGIDAGNVAARHDLNDRISSVAYFNVVNPHPEDKNVLTVFTIGEKMFKQTISGVVKEVPMDVPAQIMNNRTMMPIRYVADALGAKVNYDTTTRTAIFSKDAITVSMTLDTNIMYVNGSPVVMETAPVVQADRALVSLVNIAQAFGLNSVSAPATGDIVWDASAKTVTLFPSAQ